MLIARYTANASGVVPIFNAGYQYTVNETSSNGIYTVEIYSDTDFTSCSFAMKTDLLTIEYLKVTKTVTSLNSMFANCYSLTSINCSDWDTSNVINMDSVFLYCEALTELNVSNWDTSNVGTLNRTFYCCLNLKSLDLSNWKTTNVVDISYTFSYCSQMTELNLSGWNVDKVTNTTMTFAYCHKLDTIKIYNCKANMISTLNWSSYFPTGVISGKTRTIYCDEALVGQIEPPTNWVLSSGKESNIKVVEYKFNNTMYNLIPEFNEGFTYTYEDVVEGNVTTRTIYSYSLPTKIIFGIDNDGEFGDNKSLSLLEVLSLNADNLNTYQRMFKACENVKSINCENVTINNAYEMFAFCCSLNTLNASSYDMSNATNINNMFYHCNNLTSLDISNWSLNDSVSTSNLFDSCFSLNSVIMNNSDCVSINKIISQLPTKSSNSMGTLYVAGVSGSSQINTGDASIKYWNVSIEDVPEPPEYNIIARYTANASGVLPIFNDGYKYTVNETVSNGIYTVELSSDDDFTSCMFNSKTNLLTVEYLKVTDKVTTLSLNYYGMFDGCSNLTSVNMDGWDTSGLTSMEYAFYDCKKLASLNGINNLNINNVKNMYYLFYNCSSLTQLDLSNWNTKNVTNMGYMFNGCISLVQLDISNWDTSNVSSLAYFFNNCSKLNQITATNVSTSTLTKLVTVLPTRTSSSYGTINANNTTDELIASANAKYWNIGASVQKQLIAEYKFNNTLYDLIPEFNEEFTYTYEDIIEGETTTRTIYSDSLPTKIRFSTATPESTGLDGREKALLEVLYLDNSNLITEEQMFQMCNNLTKVDGFVNNTMHRTNHMFAGCYDLTTVNASNWDTSNVTNMAYMFFNCNSLTTIDVSNFDTSNVTDMGSMFYECYSLTSIGDLSNWNVSNVTDMGSMFYKCYNLASIGDVSNWNTGNVTIMESMFYNCESLASLNLSNWNVSNITNMSYMFYCCFDLEHLDVSNWNVSNVTDMGSMFYKCYNLASIGDVSNWNTGNVTDMGSMFHNCESLASLNLSNWNVSNITNMSYMFYCCFDLEHLDVSNWNVSNVTDMGSMFYKCYNLSELDFSRWDVSNVIDMSCMLEYNTEFKYLNLNNWILNENVDTTELLKNSNNLEKVSIINSNAFTINKIIAELPTRTSDSMSTLNISGVDDISQVNIEAAESKHWTVESSMLIAKYTANASGVVPTFNEGYQYTVNETENNGIYTVELSSDDDFTSCSFTNKTELLTVEYLKVTDKVTTFSNNSYGMFDSCSKLTYINTENWDTSNVTDMSYMFYACTSLVNLDINNWNVNNLTSMTYMFYNCNSLLSLDLSDWNTIKLNNVNGAFYYCSSLTNLDLSNWDTSNVTNISSMLYSCTNLVSLDISNFDLNKVSSIGFVFNGCSSLKKIIMNNSDYKSVNKVIVQLPTRTSDSMGTLNILGVDDITQVDVTTAESKYWTIVYEEPDNNELIQGDINDETGVFEDEVPNVVKTRYIDISNKKQILVNVLTEDVYVLKCYLYNANKELVKIIDISTDKKRMFGLDLQKIINEVINDGNE